MEIGRSSLRKQEKLRTRKDFDALKEHGKACRDPFFTVLVQAAELDDPVQNLRYGIICDNTVLMSSCFMAVTPSFGERRAVAFLVICLPPLVGGGVVVRKTII